MIFRTLKDNQPAYLDDLLARPKFSKYLRSTNSNRFVVPCVKTKTGSRDIKVISSLINVELDKINEWLMANKLSI